MKKWLAFALIVLAVAATGAIPGKAIPQELWGTWIVRRDIPTRTISCWDEAQAKKLIGTEIEYSAEVFRWRDAVTKNPTAKVITVTAKQFHDENSGGGANDSQVDFKQLGIRADSVTEIEIDHPDANITGATIEIPGDDVLLKDNNTIIFSVCSVYFEADRKSPR